MQSLVRNIHLKEAKGEELRQLLRREWIITNGLGGYSSATISGSVTWRYHGLLIAALPAPFGRMVMLNHLAEYVRFADGRTVQMCGEEPAHPDDAATPPLYLTGFRMENQLPVWVFEVNGYQIEKRVLLLHGQNTVHITYRLLSKGEKVQLELRPSVHFRSHEQGVSDGIRPYHLSIVRDRYEISAGEEHPKLRLACLDSNASFTYDGGSQREIIYRKESERGYESRGHLWSPGFFTVDLVQNKEITIIASTETWGTMLALAPDEALYWENERRKRLISLADQRARIGAAAELVLAADQFIITPAGRIADAARARAAGDEVRTIIAGYHWFTDWGRDTMISLEGLTLTTGRYTEAGWILRTFAHYIRDGLIPNMFPEGKNEGLYHTADATLWFFHALDRYVERTRDRNTLRQVLPKLVEVIELHQRGTRFGIAMDPRDGLLRQGQEGYQLTWMDAKVDNWVVTPRRGKAVEINALWYNALRLLEQWLREERGEGAAATLAELAARVKVSFNQRFWNEKAACLYDVVDGENGDDPALRPNQLLAISLKFPVLDRERWETIVQIVRERLFTPVGLRSLSSDHPDYKPKYFGDLRARDAAYHQGTVWAWLVGPLVDAWLKVYPEDKKTAHSFVEGFVPHLDDGAVGSINEIFDAEAPFTPRGCIAQAWSVAEVLRCWVSTVE